MTIEKVTCLLCRGIVSFKERNQSRFVDHMEEEHNVRYDFLVLLVASLMDEEERDGFVFQNKNKFEPQIKNLVLKENTSSKSADRNICNKDLVSMENLEEHQDNSLVNGDILDETSSEGEDSIIICEVVSNEDRERFIEIQENELHQCVTCAKYIELSERGEHDLAHIMERKVSEGLALSKSENVVHRKEIFENVSNVEQNVDDLTNVEEIFDDLITVDESFLDLMNVVGNLDLINVEDLFNFNDNEENVNDHETSVESVVCVERNIENVSNGEKSIEDLRNVERSTQDETTVERNVEDETTVERHVEDETTVEKSVKDETNVERSGEDVISEERRVEDATNVDRSVDIISYVGRSRVEDVANMQRSIEEVSNVEMSISDETNVETSIEDVTDVECSIQNVVNVSRSVEDVTNVESSAKDDNNVESIVEDVNNVENLVRSVQDATLVKEIGDYVIDTKNNFMASLSLIKEQSGNDIRNCYKRKCIDTEEDKEVRKNFFCKYCNIRLIAFGGLKKHMRNIHTTVV